MILSTLLPAKAAAALLGAGTLVLGGGAVAAYAGDLPASLQDVAHVVVGAPAADDQGTKATESPEPSDEAKAPEPSETPDPSVTPQAAGATGSAATPDPATSPSPHGPDATGPAAFGLCNAHAHGGLPEHSTAYQALAAAASAAASAAATASTAPTGTAPTAPTDPVAAYCATVLNPAGAASPTASLAPSASPSADSTAGPGHKHAKVHPNKHTTHPNHGHSGSH